MLFKNPNTLKWLYAPSKEAVFFSLRIMIASFLALTIALWMQMDSPKWAVMTVWIVAQSTSGETIKKAQSRIMGTIAGVIGAITLSALFPQQPVLFIVALSIWVGSCAWLGTLVNNSTNYGYVLAGYTAAVVGLTVTSSPNDVFMMGMARGSYNILGVLCLTLVESIFAVNINKNAKKILYNNLYQTLSGTLTVAINVLKQDAQATISVQKVFMAVSAFQNSIEFRKVELTHNKDHTIDHVRAVLSSVSIILAGLTHLNVCMQNANLDKKFQQISLETIKYLEQLIQSLKQQKNFSEQLKALNQLRWECRQIIVDNVYYGASQKQKCDPQQILKFLNDTNLYRVLRELLAEIETVLT